MVLQRLDYGGRDDQAVALIGGRSGNQWNPFREASIGRDRAARLTVLARCIVTVVAEIGSNEDKVRCWIHEADLEATG